MDMKELYADFLKHVASMSDMDVKQSIREAIQHTSNSCTWMGVDEKRECVYSKTSLQIFQHNSSVSSGFMYSSVDVVAERNLYRMSEREGTAA